MRTSTASGEKELLAAAREGDQEAFRRLVEPLRGELQAHCYRMLASVHDAEDALQDTLVRAWRGFPRFDGRSPVRPWLYRIATNVCLTAIARRPKRVLPIDYGPRDEAGAAESRPLPQSVWIEPYPDDLLEIDEGATSPAARYEQREALELAFIAALQHLPGRQRAVLILREVLGFSAKESSNVLDTSVPAVNSALQRARKTVDEQVPPQSQQATLRQLGDLGARQLVDRFVDAFEGGEVDAILELLTEDAVFSMPPYPGHWRGREAISDSWLMPGGPPGELRYVPTGANGQLALGTYALGSERDAFVPIALDVLTLEGSRISVIEAFRIPNDFPRFGLPWSLPASTPPRRATARP